MLVRFRNVPMADLYSLPTRGQREKIGHRHTSSGALGFNLIGAMGPIRVSLHRPSPHSGGQYSTMLKMMFKNLVFAAALASAQSACQPDVLVDDFRARTADMYRVQPLTVVEGGKEVPTYCDQGTGFNGCNKTLNLLGGDYGDSGAPEVMTVGQLQITATDATAQNNGVEAASHPNTALTMNYWFAKFNWENDFDLTPYAGFSLDLVAPVNSDFNITLTQWIPSNNTRGIDSNYRTLSSYITPSGKPQTLNFKWSDFGKNLDGGNFDFKNLKDLTLVNFVPVGAVFTFAKMTLVGTCGVANATTTGEASTATGAPVKSGASSAAGGAVPSTTASSTVPTSSKSRAVGAYSLSAALMTVAVFLI
ncbi:hypothetical protein BC830DRAFT_142819 [Chytriomyces sp. MP71]|nr:hypothetical protein BC830DRAFT_142819 [Chytriomyces sp. MP71]